MRIEIARLYKDLLFLEGHVADTRLGMALASDSASPTTPDPTPEGATMNLFKSLWLLGGLQSIDLRVGEDDELAFGPTYGNDVASRREFGTTRNAKPRNARDVDRAEQRVAHC